MVLVKYDKTNCQAARNGTPAIAFNPKGVVIINVKGIELTGLKDGDCIAILNDEENPEDWYFTKDADGFPLRQYGSQTTSLATNNSEVVKVSLKSLGLSNAAKSVKLAIALQPTVINKQKYWGILTTKRLDKAQ